MWEISWVVSHVDSLLFRTVLCERRIRTWHVSAVLFLSSGSLVKTCLQGIENLTLAPLLLSPCGQPLAGKTRVFMEFSQVWPHTRLAIAPHLLISCLQSPSAVILEPKNIKSVTVSIVSPSVCREVIRSSGGFQFHSCHLRSVYL